MSFSWRHSFHSAAVFLLGMIALLGCESMGTASAGSADPTEDPGGYDPQPEPDPRVQLIAITNAAMHTSGDVQFEEPLTLRSESGQEVLLERDEAGLFTGSISALPGEVLFFVIPVGDQTEIQATVVTGIDDDEEGDDSGRVYCRGTCEFGVVVPKRPGEEIVLSVSVFGPVGEPTKPAR